MTRLFGKKNKQTTIAELEEYYANQNQKKNRPVKAWLMALLSLLITIIIIIALFLGGRWLYRTLVDDNSGDTSTTTSENSGENVDLPSYDGGFEDSSSTSSEDGSDGASSESNSNDGSDQSTDGNVASNTDSNTNSEGVVTNQAASTSESNEDRLSATGSSDQEIPNTGAGDFIFVLPVIVATAGYLTALKRQVK